MNKGGTKTKKENKISKFFRSTKSEFKKIVWPTGKETVKKTLIVIGFVVLFAVLIAALDLLFNVSLIKWITK